MEASQRRISNLRWCAVSGLAALGAWVSGLVLAADAAPATEQPSQLQEVVVTAQYREEKLQDIPIAITALTADMIEQQGAQRLSDIVTSAPSVAFRTQSPAFGESVDGLHPRLGQSDFDPAIEPGVGLYIDDVYWPRLTGANFDLMDVERVEVLRGPQGTLEGRNSEGGAIRFVTKKPTADNDAYVTATYGTRNLLQLRAAADFEARRSPVRANLRHLRRSGWLCRCVQLRLRHPSQRPSPPPASGGTKCLQYSQGDIGYRALRGILRYEPIGPVR